MTRPTLLGALVAATTAAALGWSVATAAVLMWPCAPCDLRAFLVAPLVGWVAGNRVGWWTRPRQRRGGGR